LVQQWASKFYETTTAPGDWAIATATQAARWGADQELEACCEWLDGGFGDVGNFPATLRAARRPKPPSLKEQALEVVTGLEKRWDLQCDLTLLRRALEQLDD
jgi:hypothetical protein